MRRAYRWVRASRCRLPLLVSAFTIIGRVVHFSLRCPDIVQLGLERTSFPHCVFEWL